MKRSPRFWICVALLYVTTWIGGHVSHRRSLLIDAQRRYDEAERSEREKAAWYKQEGKDPPWRITRDGGPVAKINWSVPVVPGVLLADSYYVVGPLYGRGGVSIVIYYGFGSVQLGPIMGWVS